MEHAKVFLKKCMKKVLEKSEFWIEAFHVEVNADGKTVDISAVTTVRRVEDVKTTFYVPVDISREKIIKAIEDLGGKVWGDHPNIYEIPKYKIA